MRKISSKYIYGILLFLLIFFHAVNNFIWIKNNPAALSWDSLYHLNDQLSRFYDLANRNISHSFDFFRDAFNYLIRIFNIKSTWPRLVYFITFLIQKLLGRSDIIARMSNMLYFTILICFTYLIGNRCLNRFSGILAAVFVSFYPGIFAFSRSYGLDLPLTAMTVLNIYFLLRTERFSNFKYSLIFGLSFGAGILTKGQIVLFLSGPVLYVLLTAFIKKEFKIGLLLNLFIVFVSVFLISSIWWWGNKGMLTEQFLSPLLKIFSPDMPASLTNFFLHSDISATPFPFSFKWFFFYLYDIFCLISPLFFLIFAIGLYYFIKLRNLKYKNLFIWWIIIPYAVLTIICFKEARYFLPGFPAFALISAFGLSSIKGIKKMFIVPLILTAAAVQFFIISYYSPVQGSFFRVVLKPSLMEKGEVFSLYSQENDNYKAVVDEIAAYIKQGTNTNEDFYMGIIEDPAEYFLVDKRALTMEYLLRLCFPKVKICRPFYPNTMLFKDYYKNFKYLILITRETPPFSYSMARMSRGGEYDKSIKSLGKEIFADIKDKFDAYEPLLKKTLYPDGYNVYLMKNDLL